VLEINLGKTYLRQGQISAALKLLEHALHTLEEHLGL
jgi:hypothetical protein